MKIGLVVFDAFTDLDLVLHWDLLNRVRLFNLHADWTVKILGTATSHVSVSGLSIPTSGSIDEASTCDAVLLCSGPGTRNLLGNTTFLNRLKLDPEKQLLAAQCSGALILGEMGFLRGKPVSAFKPRLF